MNPLGKLAGVVVAVCLLQGCIPAATPGKELPTVPYESIRPKEPRPSVCYEVTYDDIRVSKEDREKKNTQDLLKNGRDNAQTNVDAVLKTAKVFAEQTYGASDTGCHLLFRWTTDGTGGFEATVGGAVCGASWGIVPMVGRLDFKLRVKVHRDGKLLKEYTYADHEGIGMGIVMLPILIANGDLNKVEVEIKQNMVRTFLRDLMRDDLLWRSSETTSMPTAGISPELPHDARRNQ